MKLIYLPDKYDLVVGDRFELFYRGIIRSMNPYKYYIYINCDKGNPYPRYFSYTPKENEVGDYKLEVTLFDDFHNEIEKAETILHVVNPIRPKRKLNVLCFGDSLTFNGVWPYEGYRRFTKDDGEPQGLGFKDSLNFVGSMQKEEIGYEGYGGWQWRHFVKNEAVPMNASVWLEVEHHNLDDNDQHSVWESANLKWVLESITPHKLKFKRGVGNYSCLPNVDLTFKNVEGGIHKEDIVAKRIEFEQGNPFYDETIDGPNFKKYCEKHQYPDLDLVYILLTWNGQYKAYNDDFSHFEPFIISLLERIHNDYPNCKIGLLGIQSPSINGGIAANYGAHGFYHDVFGEVTTAYNYAEYLQKLVNRNEFKSYCRYIDTKGQFDVENNMPKALVKVNNRNNTEEYIGTNGVHPTMEGYLQIGDVFYRALVADIDKYYK